MNERLRKLRKYLNLTQVEFGNKINIKGATISDIEKGKLNLTERNLQSICKEYNVNEQWLRTGKGEMFIEDDKAILEQYAEKYNFSALDKSIFKIFLSLTPEERNIAEQFLFKLVNGIIDNKDLYEQLKSHYENNGSNIISKKTDKYSSEFDSDSDIDKELESYRHELEYEKDMKMSQVSHDTKDESHA
ncbi:MAG: helix-turn-helix domain-containing protein [Clostridia bacterium]|nr:helix-turn-helix domain-containing protein [Clostridia bacterium]